jgi:hypothetical protein
LTAFAALAHDAPHPRRAALRLSAAAIELRVDYEVAAGEQARALRQAFDRNRDGRLEGEEQAALAEHLARTATLRTRLSVDGTEVALRRGALRPEKVDQPASSTALLAVRVELRGEWPKGAGARRVVLRDDDPSGHVPVAVTCEKCRIAGSSSGAWERVGADEYARGATTSSAAPLELLVRL